MNDLNENYFYVYRRNGRTLMTPSIQLAVKRANEEEILVYSDLKLTKKILIHSDE